MEFEAYADLAKLGARLDVAAEQISFITHDGLDANSVTMSKTVHALLITKCKGKALISSFLGSPTLWIGSVASAQERVRGQGWSSHSRALERYPTCQMGEDAQRGMRRPW